jgi:paraquat-inducible protein A
MNVVPTAARAGILRCGSCAQLHRAVEGVRHASCTRCGAALHARKPASLERTLAYLIAATILYVPANLYPVMESGSLFLNQSDTIWSGVVYLYTTGSWMLALIVLVASIVIPASKLLSLGWLVAAAWRRSTMRPQRRARMYRVTHWIGRWSMVDIYVGAVLVTLVQFSAFGSIVPGPGAVYFGAVVVLTMLASMSFDPRLTWDPVDDARG